MALKKGMCMPENTKSADDFCMREPSVIANYFTSCASPSAQEATPAPSAPSTQGPAQDPGETPERQQLRERLEENVQAVEKLLGQAPPPAAAAKSTFG